MLDLVESLSLRGDRGGSMARFVRPWGETTVDFTPPWQRRAYAEVLGAPPKRIRGR
jgi:lysyl-tRNA synthetase class 2